MSTWPNMLYLIGFVESEWAGLHWIIGWAELVGIGQPVIEIDRIAPSWVDLDNMGVCLHLVDMG